VASGMNICKPFKVNLLPGTRALKFLGRSFYILAAFEDELDRNSPVTHPRPK
jgi:hypothetical protein